MEIVKTFGLNPVLLAAQIVNFLIVFILLKKFLYKPVLEVLRKRQITIKEGLKQTEEARIKLEKIVIEETNILRQAQLQSRKIIEDAKTESSEIAKKMGEETRKQAEKLMSDTKEQLAQEAIGVEKRLALKTGEIAVTLLEKALKDFFSNKEQQEIMSQALVKIKKNT
jgi:F-type H+-transporting ATPase subunit b